MSESDPRRLLEDASGPQRDLLEAWSTMRAPEGARLRAAALLAGSVAGAGAGGAAVALVMKVVVLAALAMAVAVAVYVTLPSGQDGAGAPTRIHAVLAPSSPPAAPSASAATAMEATELVAIPIGALPSAIPGAGMPKGMAAPASSSLSVQLGELDAIRDSLAAGQRDQALGALDRFSARHAASPLAEEAAALRFDVQSARGDRAAASEAARLFLTNYPQSPYAARIRRASIHLP